MFVWLGLQAAALLGTATLAVQTIVLASSLATSIPSLSTASDAKISSPRVEAVEHLPDTGNHSIIKAVSFSTDLETVLDSRAFWIISSVRLVAMPIIMVVSTVVCHLSPFRFILINPLQLRSSRICGRLYFCRTTNDILLMFALLLFQLFFVYESDIWNPNRSIGINEI